jgi:hypothetical protein
MSPYRFRDEESSTGTTIASVLIGAVAGFAVGMFVAQRVGGFSGLKSRFRRGVVAAADTDGTAPAFDVVDEAYDEIEDAEDDVGVTASAEDDEDFNGMDADESDSAGTPLLEERVLEAFNNDPILAERAIDIGSVGAGIIELAGWVDSDDEAEHAMTVARGIVGVETVVNRLLIDDEEQEIGDTIRRFNEGDPALTDARWEGQQVGTGKRRQGTSDEADRHADPKPELENRWLSEREAVRHAAEDIDEISAERRTRKKGAKAPRADEAEPLS